MLAELRELSDAQTGGIGSDSNPRWGMATPATATFLEELEDGLNRLGFTEIELTAFLVDIDGLPASEVSRMADAIAGDTALWWSLSDGCFVAVYLSPVKDPSFMSRAVERCMSDAVSRIGAFATGARALVRAMKRWSYEVVVPGQFLNDIQNSPADLVNARVRTAA